MQKKSLITLVVVVVLGAAGIFIAAATGQKPTDVCRTTGKNHTVVIANNTMNPKQTTGSYCDTLTIKNTDDVTREIGFGAHDHHEPYDGVAERVLHKNESFTVTMTKRGTFHFHDHFHDEVEGSFVVK